VKSRCVPADVLSTDVLCHRLLAAARYHL